MASPPSWSATSPPGPLPLALPRQRPSLAVPKTAKSRKPSIASATSHSHPLRQTSFPPQESLESQHAAAEDAALRYSPSQGSLEDEFSDSEIVSAISGPTANEDGATKKRKRGEKRGRGRPPRQSGFRNGSVSLVNGEDGGRHSGTPATNKRGGTAGAHSSGDDEDENEEDEDLTRQPSSGANLGMDQALENQQKSMFRNYLERIDALPLTHPERQGLTARDMGERYDVWNRAKLKAPDVRKLVNQTLSQSVPGPVVTVVSSYTKMFAGILIEEARKFQSEWMAVEEKRADGAENPAYKRLKQSHGSQEANGDSHRRPESSQSDKTLSGVVKHESSSSPAQLNGDQEQSSEGLYSGGAGGLSTSLEECDRGPLTPDHLREALRRYRKARKGGTVGFTGLSLGGREVAAPRMGGRRLFR